MDPREFKTPFEVQERQDAPGGIGGALTTWVPVGTVWGKWWAKGGQERQISAMNQAKVEYSVQMHPFPGLTEAHRLLDLETGATWAIVFINRADKARWALDCVEYVGVEAQ